MQISSFGAFLPVMYLRTFSSETWVASAESGTTGAGFGLTLPSGYHHTVLMLTHSVQKALLDIQKE